MHEFSHLFICKGSRGPNSIHINAAWSTLVLYSWNWTCGAQQMTNVPIQHKLTIAIRTWNFCNQYKTIKQRSMLYLIDKTFHMVDETITVLVHYHTVTMTSKVNNLDWTQYSMKCHQISFIYIFISIQRTLNSRTKQILKKEKRKKEKGEWDYVWLKCYYCLYIGEITHKIKLVHLC